MKRELDLDTTYWLTTWLESRRVENVTDAERLLANDKVINELREVAGQWAAHVTSPPAGRNLSAGTGLRLDDLLTCPSPMCRKQQVDILFRHAWHYFDYILLPDGFGDLVRDPPEWPADYFRRYLVNIIDVVLHIKQIGGSALVWYYPKPEIPSSVIHKAVDELGDELWCEAWQDVEHTLLHECSFKSRHLGRGNFNVRFSDPFLGVAQEISIRAGKRVKGNYKRLYADVAHQILHEHICNLEEDLAVSRLIGGALGSTVWSHERVLTRAGGSRDYELALRLCLPSLSNVPIRDLISLRIDERDAFDAFRGTITKAAEELIREGSDKKSSDVIQDMIEPELAKIRRRLQTAERALARKTALSVVIAAMSVTCGVLLGLPIASIGSLGVIPAVVAAGAKYLDEKQAVEMSDMFFLWKALEHAKGVRN